MEGILHLAKLLGWRAYHTHDSRRSEAGFPDLVLARGDRVVFAELKSKTGRLTPAQHEWLAALEPGPTELYVWRAGVDTFEDIQRILR